MHTLASTLSLSSTSATSAISDRAAQLLTNIQSTFKRRNAIVRRVADIAGHRFEVTFLTEPTKCSHCNQIIWGLWGQQCKPCKLMAHRKCLQAIDTMCIFDQATQNLLPSHRVEGKTFISPTMCDHCGTLIVGKLFFKQGVECSSCVRSVHHDCKTLHFVPRKCHPGRATCQSHHEAYEHQSRIGIEDFEITRLLGAGSFSKVYLARLKNHDENSSEEFAIKVIKKTNPVVSSDPEGLFTEWKALNLGRNYPFLTIGHCCFQSRERLYFVMEHVVGKDLVYHIGKERKFTEYRARFYSAEIVLALSYLHRQHVIYRDLKLDNVILDKTGHCKLLDFGMSKILAAGQMRTRTFCGTPSYMSPEIIRGDEYDYSTDWWSLGVLLYEMLTGFSPFEARTEEATYEAIKCGDLYLPPNLSVRARSILEGLLTREPQRRLGCQLIEGCSKAIRDHPFFLFSVSQGCESHQWEEMECKQIKPPYTPTMADFHLDGDAKRVEFTPIGSNELNDVQQSEFEKFSFYSESFGDSHT